MSELLKGKYAVITGARQGIGRAIAEIYAANGCNLWVCSRTDDEDFRNDMNALSEKYGVEIMPVFFDMMNEEEIKAAAKQIISSKLPVDILVNNAGATCRALFQMTSMKTLRDVFEVDFFGPFLLTQLLLRPMSKSTAGSIINIVSTAGLDGNAGRSAYGSAKAALACFTQVLSAELGTKNIRVNAIAPGVTQTTLLTYSEEQLEEIVKGSAQGVIGQPQDIANTALFLASEQSSFITGQIIRVDGLVL